MHDHREVKILAVSLAWRAVGCREKGSVVLGRKNSRWSKKRKTLEFSSCAISGTNR